ncbi:hypothetical protein I656_02277 [Geobacillus sp. WSUCF1]|nr:hypothetical protein I656_02277 [Geobacillus sp. WSUCF1]
MSDDRDIAEIDSFVRQCRSLLFGKLLVYYITTDRKSACFPVH